MTQALARRRLIGRTHRRPKAETGLFNYARLNPTATHDCIMQACYSELDKAFATAEFDETGLGYSAKGHEQFRKAVALERARLIDRPRRGKEAEAALGRELQKQTGAPSVVIDRIVRAAATKRLRSKEGEGKKPN